MKHYVLTRAVYDPARWSPDEARRRLTLFEGVTCRSLASQQAGVHGTPEWEWLIAVHPDDPLLEARRRAAERTLHPVTFLPVDPAGVERSAAAMLGYQAAWQTVIDSSQAVLTTRIDDDDGFAPWAFSVLHRAARRTRRHRELGADDDGFAPWAFSVLHRAARRTRRHREFLMLPNGIRVWGGRYTRVRHETNAWVSLLAPAGDSATVYSFRHREVKKHHPVRMVDERTGWLWVRHPDVLSGYRKAVAPVTDDVRRLFDVDWALLDSQPRVPAEHGGDVFR